MAVPMKRFQQRKLMYNSSSPMLYYLKQDPGSFKTYTINTLAAKIELNGALTREDVIHSINAFIRLLQEALVEGNKVKVDGLGTFHITTTCTGVGELEACTVRNIRRVNVRFSVDNALRLVNESIATTRSAPNNVSFYIKGEKAPGDGSGEPENPFE